MNPYNKVYVDTISGQGNPYRGEEINFVVTKLFLQNQLSQNNQHFNSNSLFLDTYRQSLPIFTLLTILAVASFLPIFHK